MTTQELIREYTEYKFRNGKTDKKRFENYYDREEIYAYEKKLNKTILNMSKDEIFDMIFTFNFRDITFVTFKSMCEFFNGLFGYYIDNYGRIKAPLTDEDIKVSNTRIEYYKRHTPIVNEEEINKLLEGISKENSDFTLHIECMIRLFYEGVYSFDELAGIKAEDVHLDENYIWVGNRKVFISDRIVELLNKLLTKTTIITPIGRYGEREFAYVSWNGSYLKFPTDSPETFSDSKEKPRDAISHRIRGYSMKYIKKPLTIKDVFGVGLYDRMRDFFGDSKADSLIVQSTSPAESREFADFLKQNAPSVFAGTGQKLSDARKFLIVFTGKNK